jgi:hypothetical protein
MNRDRCEIITLLQWGSVFYKYANASMHTHIFIYCRVFQWLLEGFWIGCLDLLHLYTTLVITSNIVLPLIYTLQFTVTPTLGFSVFSSRILATDFNMVIIPVSLQIPHLKPSIHRLTFKSQLDSLPSLLNHLRSLSQETPSIITPAGLGSSSYSLRGGSNRKHNFRRYS